MSPQETIMVILYIVAVGGVLILFQFWSVGIIILIILLILVMQKMYTDRKIGGTDENINKIVEKTSHGLDNISRGVEGIRNDFSKSFYMIDSRFQEERKVNESMMEQHYSALAKKMIDIENRINEIKRWLGKE